jgi:hypothetical protein
MNILLVGALFGGVLLALDLLTAPKPGAPSARPTLKERSAL